MKKKTYKIIICISLVLMLFTSFGNVFGAINESYKVNTKVTNNGLDAKIKDSILLDALANMINAVASLAESLIGGIFNILTGDNIFPWADRIIFNAIPFLDINFLNPDSNSLFGVGSGETILGRVVKQVYSTIFSLAVLFLGVAVGVMAIRLAISSIAAEKAKYKQAIVNWATCIVMLFLMHYILAFIFWVNEQMVEIASNVLISAIEKEKIGKVDFQAALDGLLSADERVNNFIKASWDATEDAKKVLTDNPEIANSFIIDTSDYIGVRIPEENLEDDASGEWNIGKFFSDKDNLMGKIAIPRMAVDVLTAKSIAALDTDTYAKNQNRGYYTATINQTIDGDPDEYNYKTQYVFTSRSAFKENQDEYKTSLIANLMLAYYAFRDNSDARWSSKVFFGTKQGIYLKAISHDADWYRKSGVDEDKVLAEAAKDSGMRLNTTTSISDLKSKYTIEELEKILGANMVKEIVEYRIRVDGSIDSAATGRSSLSTDASDIIANLGSFFKQSAYVYQTEKTDEEGKTEKVTGWRASKVSVTGALLYAIFIFQSCVYLIMYVKRLFYVMMLSMFGPIVVIYDFFMKSAGS